MINIEQSRSGENIKLNVSYIDKNSNIKFFEFLVPKDDHFEWVKCSENDRFKDNNFKFFLDSSPVKKKQVNYLNKYRIIEVMEGLNDDVKNLIFHNHEPRVFFCDIENDKDPVTKAWPKPENATGKVTAISLVDSINRHVHLLGLKKISITEQNQMGKDVIAHLSSIEDFSDNDIKIEFHFYDDEADMLYAFWSKFMKNIYFITGWNFIGYDWPYLLDRSKKLLLDPYSLMGAKKLWDGSPMHKVVVDYLDLYKKFDFKIIKENFTLDYTASQVLNGVKKVSYNGTLDQLYESNPYKYFLYNIIDAYLVKLIEDVLGMLSLYVSIGNSTKAEMNTLLATIAPVESIITRYYFEENLVIIPSKPAHDVDLAYEGGYVYEPVPGMYRWVLGMDFSSLYPTVQQQFNISPETFRGINFEREILETEIRLPNGAIFDNSKDSIFRKYLRDYYKKRKDSKNTEFAIIKELEQLKHILKEKGI